MEECAGTVDISKVIVLELPGLSPVSACSAWTNWEMLFCWQGMVDMFLLGGLLRCVENRLIMFLMGGLAPFHMARPVTFLVGGLGMFSSGGTVQVRWLGGCLVGACVFSPLPPPGWALLV